jgi:transketolase
MLSSSSGAADNLSSVNSAGSVGAHRANHPDRMAIGGVRTPVTNKVWTANSSPFADPLRRGAYVLAGADEDVPDIILIATGRELPLATAAHEKLTAAKIRCRVVSMPSWRLFEQQNAAYRQSVLPGEVRARLAVERDASVGWEAFVGPSGATVITSSFGVSAPPPKSQERFAFLLETILRVARDLIGKSM